MSAVLSALQNSAIAIWIVEAETLWAYPTVLTLHTVGLALCVGASLALALRTLGAGRRLPFAVFQHVAVPFWTGFAINASSGVLLFMASAEVNGVRPLFFLKISLIALAVVSHTRLAAATVGGPSPDSAAVPAGAARWAGCAVVFWLAAIVAGRMMAYLP